MILLKRALPLLSSIAILVIGEVMVMRGTMFWYALVALALTHCAAYAYLLSHRAAKRDALFFFAVPATLLIAGFFLVVFLGDRWMLQAVIILLAFLYGWYAENVFHYLYQPAQYQPYALEHISSYLNILSFFMFFCGLFASRVFLSIALAVLVTIGAVVIMVFTLLMSWINKLQTPDAGVLNLVHLVVMIELLGIVSLLPTSFFVSALLLTVPYYLMANLIRHSVRGTLKRDVVYRYMTVSLSAFLITLLTAPWS